MLKLFQLETCPYCEMVREKLSELSLEYEKINVPMEREKRTDVFNISGQYLVPVLKDEDKVIDDEEKIIEYLEKKFNKG